ncbi:MAG TPA: colanic acid biosynthesis glycosyltransferase WcaL, partial [Thermoanaerobaculia bacterium]|nr:colanic acid biosynthesis glycosyltransferase WcaL [Thermoanaerobaculia bacterium]
MDRRKPRAEGASVSPGFRVAYLVSRFPKLTETFIAEEIAAVERGGVAVDLYPLQRERTALVHPTAATLMGKARFTPLLAPRYASDHLRAVSADPGSYARIVATLVRANWGSARYLLGALAFFPKAVHLAGRLQRSGIGHVHAHFASHPAAVAFVIHRLTGLRWSFTAHGSDLHRDRHMLAEKVAAASFVVAISEYNRRVILDSCGEWAASKVIVVHCGV